MPTMVIDSCLNDARPLRLPDARGPPFPLASCDSHAEIDAEFSKSPGWGGARENSGGARAGAGRPRNPVHLMPSSDAMHWYVARAHFGQGEEADWEIRDAGFDVVTARKFKPATKAYRTPGGRLMPATEQSYPLLFVRYVIARFCFPGPALARIVNLDSVERVISGGHLTNNGIGIPISVPDRSIDQLRRKLHSDGCLYPPGHMYAREKDEQPMGLEPGDAITLLDGPLAGHAALYEVSDGESVMMLLSMFNRDNVRASMLQSAVKPG